MVFHWSLSDSKSPQVSRTLFSILFVVVVWMVFIHPPISKSSSPFNDPLVTVPKASITIDIIVTFMFHSFSNSQARSRYLSFFSLSFSFILWSAGTAKSTILHFTFFLLINQLIGLGSRVFANDPGDLGSTPGRVIPKTLKMVLNLIPTCLTLSIMRYVSRVKWSNPGKGVASSPTPWRSTYWKGSLPVTLDYCRQLYFTFLL